MEISPQVHKLVAEYYRTLRENSYDEPDEEIEEIVVYGKDYCPYCHEAHILINKHPSGRYVEMDETFEAPEEHASDIKQAKSIPIVFQNSKYIGGLSDLKKVLKI